jgi:hypothetical protein
VEHVLFIVARAEYFQHDVQLMVVMLGGLGQLRSDVEFLILIELQAVECSAFVVSRFSTTNT